MKTPIELAAQRRVTRAFIQADVVRLVLHTRVPGQGSNKGITVDGPDRLPQYMRLIPQNISPNSGARYDNTVSSTASYLFVLMGEWDAEMDLYDWWEDPTTGQLLQIDTMLPDNGYERKGCVNIYERRK